MDWVAVGSLTTVALLFLTVAGGLYTIKGDTRVLKQRADATDRLLEKMDHQIEKIDGVLVVLAENKGRMELIDQRVSMQGGRLDDMTKRFNEWVDSSRDSNRQPIHR